MSHHGFFFPVACSSEVFFISDTSYYCTVLYYSVLFLRGKLLAWLKSMYFLNCSRNAESNRQQHGRTTSSGRRSMITPDMTGGLTSVDIFSPNNNNNNGNHRRFHSGAPCVHQRRENALWTSSPSPGQARLAQLTDWVGSPQEPPAVTWLSGLFNPQSFLTAIMQVRSAEARTRQTNALKKAAFAALVLLEFASCGGQKVKIFTFSSNSLRIVMLA